MKRIEKRRTVSGTLSGIGDVIIPLGVVGILAAIAYKYFGPTPGAVTSNTNNAQNTANTQTTADAAYKASSAVVPQSMSDTQLSSIATQISNSFMDGGSDTGTIIDQLSLVNNITDLYRLMQLFGTKANAPGMLSACYYLNINCQALDLASFVRAQLTADELAEVNQNFSGNGINYQF